jgi:hypothetical protein
MKSIFALLTVALMSLSSAAFASVRIGYTGSFHPGRHSQYTISAGNQVFHEIQIVKLGMSKHSSLQVTKVVVNYANGGHQVLRDVSRGIDNRRIVGYRHYAVRPLPIASITIAGQGSLSFHSPASFYVVVNGK